MNDKDITDYILSEWDKLNEAAMEEAWKSARTGVIRGSDSPRILGEENSPPPLTSGPKKSNTDDTTHGKEL